MPITTDIEGPIDELLPQMWALIPDEISSFWKKKLGTRQCKWQCSTAGNFLYVIPEEGFGAKHKVVNSRNDFLLSIQGGVYTYWLSGVKYTDEEVFIRIITKLLAFV